MPNPRTGAYEGLGYRVPLIVVSPYAKPQYVSTSQHEIATYPALHRARRSVCRSLGAGSGITYADQRADAFDDVFDYSQKPIEVQKDQVAAAAMQGCPVPV